MEIKKGKEKKEEKEKKPLKSNRRPLATRTAQK